MDELTTRFQLDEPTDESALRPLLELIATDDWLAPTHLGRMDLDRQLQSRATAVDEIVAAFTRQRAIVFGSAERGFMHLAGKRGGLGLTYCVWVAPAQWTDDDSGRAQHAQRMVALMQRLGCELAVAHTGREHELKAERWVHDAAGERLVLHDADRANGLIGLYWRTFFRPAYRAFFGPALGHVARDVAGVALVELCERPGDAVGDDARAREAELIATLGSDAFYDRAAELPAKRLLSRAPPTTT